MRSLTRRRQIVADAAFATVALAGLALVGVIAIAELSTSFATIATCGVLLLPAAAVALRPGVFDIASLGLTGAIIVGLPPFLVAITLTILVLHPFGFLHP